MLWNILQAYDGKLPEDITVIFCNTGLEHRETYEFIHRIEENWCPVTWLEYALTEESKASYAQVQYETASRKGEPFQILLHASAQ
jgi:3'-phosphoadenosine 5'-phosphosulfate sulfotransferase (PAPS reductase)/FAD synthetase